MNTPSVSIFQGLDAIKVNSTLERAEEEEAEEDQRRRNAELGNILLNAFDDLGDDESTMDSTHYPSDEHLDAVREHHQQINVQKQPIQPAPMLPPMLNNGLENYASEMHHLKMLLESRTNELENLKQSYSADNKKIDELQKRLTLTQAELDRALSTKNNTYELLVESKEKCSNLENTIAKLKNEKKMLENENHTLVGKLETTQTMLADVQRKYDMVERDLNKNNEKNADIRRRQMEDRHRAELEMLRQQFEQVADKLDKKTSDLENMSARYHALQNTHELMLVDKAGKINDLNHALSEAQQKCEELLSKPDYFQENLRLQKLVASLQTQIDSMERTKATLNERLDQITSELNLMDSLETPRNLSQRDGCTAASTPLNIEERMSNLRKELYLALGNLKDKRDEIRRLQQNLEEKNEEIRHFREEDNRSLVQITTLKEEKIRLENRLKVLEEEYKAQVREDETRDLSAQNLNDSKIKTLKDQVECLTKEKLQILEQLESLRKELEESEAIRKNLNVQVENLKVDVDEKKQEYKQMQRNLDEMKIEHEEREKRQILDRSLEQERYKFLLQEAQTEIDRLKSLYVEICNAKETLTYENEKLRNTDLAKDLQIQREKVSTLQRALQLAEIKSSELSKALETEKLCHERDMQESRNKYEKQRLAQDLKASKDSSNNCTKCIDLMAEVTKFEIKSLKLNNVIAAQKKEIDDLNEELRTTKSLMTELTEKLKVSQHQEQLIKELKTKAQLFEDYIKTQSSSSEHSLTSPKHRQQQNNNSTPSSDKGVGTSPEQEKTALRTMEARIREDMAKIFAAENKNLQQCLDQMEAQNQCLKTEYKYITVQLQQRQNEVEVLKKAILSEREKMMEMFDEKDTNTEKLIQKHKVIFLQCQDELQQKSQRITELAKELDERQTQIEAERKSMKAVMTQWETQRKQIDEIEQEWRDKLKNLEKAHANSIASWQSKYNSAKRTAANYKRYSEDKEAHMLKEYERLKIEYDASLSKIEIRMKEILERKNQEIKEARIAAEKNRAYFVDNKENQPNN